MLRFGTNFLLLASIASFFQYSIALNVLTIDDYLEEHLESYDVELNLKAASDLLRVKLEAGTGEDLDALETFTLLSQVYKSNKCDQESYEILLKNDKLTGEFLHKNPSPSRRIDIIFYKIALDHAIECSAIYPIHYNAKQLQLDSILVDRVKTFLKDIIKYEKNTGLWQKYISKEDLTIKGNGQIAYDTIKSLAKYDSNVQFMKPVLSHGKNGLFGKSVHKEKIEELYKKYLVEPCQNYVDQLGEGLFIPANYDAKLYHNVDSHQPYFYFAWANYQFCKVLVHEDYETILAEIISIAESR